MNYYEILGVNKNATLDQIKRAFREKAKATHPDLNLNNPNASEQFNEIATAYAVLSNPVEREKYDNGFDVDSNATEFTVNEIKIIIAMIKAQVKPYKRAAKKHIIVGGLWLALGLAVSIGSYISAMNSPYGGPVVIMWGAVIFGAIQAVRGYSAYNEIMNLVKEAEDELWSKL